MDYAKIIDKLFADHPDEPDEYYEFSIEDLADRITCRIETLLLAWYYEDPSRVKYIQQAVEGRGGGRSPNSVVLLSWGQFEYHYEQLRAELLGQTRPKDYRDGYVSVCTTVSSLLCPKCENKEECYSPTVDHAHLVGCLKRHLRNS